MLRIVWTHRNQHALDQLDTLVLGRPHRHEAIVFLAAERASDGERQLPERHDRAVEKELGGVLGDDRTGGGVRA